ncbi:MAG: hypothetical protein ACR2KV_16955 [Solirubrobacteraceae bacterium]
MAAGAFWAAPASAATVTVTATAVTAVEGAAFSGPVATIGDLAVAGGCPAPSTYAVVVTWADQTTSAGVVGPGTATILNCTYPVTVAGHTFAEEGDEIFMVAVTPTGGGAPASATGQATVADATLVALGTQLSATVGTPIQATVATVTDADPNATAAQYVATVAWGDGTTTTDPVIAAGMSGFTVGATHTYATAGTYATTVTIRDDGGSSATASGGATVGTAPPPPPPPPAVDADTTAPKVGVLAPGLAAPGGFSLRVTCPASAPRCRGVARVVIHPGRRRKSPLADGQAVGSALFVLRSGESRTLAIGVPVRLRRTLRGAREARLGGVAIAFGTTGRSAAVTGPTAVLRTTGLH